MAVYRLQRIFGTTTRPDNTFGSAFGDKFPGWRDRAENQSTENHQGKKKRKIRNQQGTHNSRERDQQNSHNTRNNNSRNNSQGNNNTGHNNSRNNTRNNGNPRYNNQQGSRGNNPRGQKPVNPNQYNIPVKGPYFDPWGSLKKTWNSGNTGKAKILAVPTVAALGTGYMLYQKNSKTKGYNKNYRY